MAVTKPFNIKKWVDENRHLLKPPVGNKQLFVDTDFIVMVVGGPNARKDYHYNESEEFFYQLEGDIIVRIQEDGRPVDMHIKEGDIFLLPPRVPHSPMRKANTVGLVIEKKRADTEIDALQWYCENCNHKLYEEQFMLKNIETAFKAIFEKYYGSLELRTCKECGHVMEPPHKL